MSALLKNLLGHLVSRFQPSSPNGSAIAGTMPAADDGVTRLYDSPSPGDLLIECLRGRSACGGEFGGRSIDSQRAADLRYEMTMAATRMF